MKRSRGYRLSASIVLGAILLSAFAVRMYRLGYPDKYVFDEVYHAVTAKLHAKNDPTGYEWWHPPPEPDTAIDWLHPPLAKLFQAGSIATLGENPIAWRLPSVIAGLLLILTSYWFARLMSLSKRSALIVAFMVSIDGLLFTQSRIAMNDIFISLFYLLGVVSYLRFVQELARQNGKPTAMDFGVILSAKPPRKWFVLSGLSLGLAIATKWSGAFLLGVFLLDQGLKWIRLWKAPSILNMIRIFAVWIALPLVIYILSYSQFWLQGHTWDQFVGLHKQIWHYQTTLEAEHPYQSTPLQWITNTRPVWFSVEYTTGGVGNIYNLGNPVLFWLGAIGMGYLLIRVLHKFNWSAWFLLVAYGLVWFPWLFSPRILFFYHYAPAVAFLAMIFGLAYEHHARILPRHGKKIVLGLIALATLWFIVFYPHLTQIVVNAGFANGIYFAVPGWK